MCVLRVCACMTRLKSRECARVVPRFPSKSGSSSSFGSSVSHTRSSDWTLGNGNKAPTRTHTRTHAYTRTHTHAHAHTHARTHTHTHTKSSEETTRGWKQRTSGKKCRGGRTEARNGVTTTSKGPTQVTVTWVEPSSSPPPATTSAVDSLPFLFPCVSPPLLSQLLLLLLLSVSLVDATLDAVPATHGDLDLCVRLRL